MIKLLENYPFKDIGVTIGEGFSAYDGNLRDVPGKPHWGIDYVLKKNGEFAGFEVYSMFEGNAVFGVSEVLGKYFVISKTVGDVEYQCVYSHLDNINENLQKYAIIQGDKEFMIPVNYFLGWASVTGDTRSIRQLHIELSEKKLGNGERKKVDPYGVFDKLSSGKYKQPGESLAGLRHYFTTDTPGFGG